MSVWESDEKMLILESLISPSKIILFEKLYQAFDTVFHQKMSEWTPQSVQRVTNVECC